MSQLIIIGKVLGDSVPYLHPDFDVSTPPARWLAGKLGVQQADVDGVLDYLKILSQTEASIEKIEPIYEFLWSEDEHLWRFEEESLIFTPEPEPRWWRTDEVFWEDESAVFGNDRGLSQNTLLRRPKVLFQRFFGSSSTCRCRGLRSRYPRCCV